METWEIIKKRWEPEPLPAQTIAYIFARNDVLDLLDKLATLQAENKDLQDTATRIRIANTALVDVCKEAERYIGGIPVDKIDWRDADPILDKLDWAITQAEGWAAERTKATEALKAENEALRAALVILLPILKAKADAGRCVHDTLYGDTWANLYDSARRALAGGE